MKIESTNKISPEIVQRADVLSKETGRDFRTLLEELYRDYLLNKYGPFCRKDVCN